MTIKTFRRVLPVPPRTVFDWHAAPGAISRLSPAWGPGRVVTPAPLENGAKAKLEVTFGPAGIDWIAEHVDVVDGEQFVDVQRSGPFKKWRHSHRFLSPARAAGRDVSFAADATLLEDEIDYEVPLGFLGKTVAGGSIANDLDRLFRFRHDVTEGDLNAMRSFGPKAGITVGLTGAGGLVGRALTAYLGALGHKVIPVSRDQKRGGETWSAYDVTDELEGADAIVHLAGETLMGRWNDDKRAKIMDSRVLGTKALIEDLRALDVPPRIFLCASAVGFYGDRGAESLDEGAPRGDGFLADVVDAWERATEGAAAEGWRVANLRFGVIFDAAGGALPKMALPTKFGAGGPMGSGDQYLPAVGPDDVLDVVLRCLTDDRMVGPVNVVAPEVLRQKELAAVLGRVLHRPTFLPAPKFALRAAVGASAEEMLFASQRVVSTRLNQVNHAFRTPTVESMIRHALGRY